MRTVHETEALRPSDPVPKHHSSNPQNKSQRLRLTFNKYSAGANGKPEDDANSPVSGKGMSKEGPASPTAPSLGADEAEYERNNPTFTRDPQTGDWIAHFPSDIHFTDKELALPLKHLLVLCHRQTQWATEIGEELKAEEAKLNVYRKTEWIAKEVLLRHYIKQETIKADQELEGGQNDQNADDPAASTIEDVDQDETVVPSREQESRHGEIPPYPYIPHDDDDSRNSHTAV
jgi:hypothetical protein